MKFSDKKELERKAVEWCERYKIPATPLNIITALDQNGLLVHDSCPICGYIFVKE